eukprot:TRINITY_DN11190_c0_g2_i1.p1 TRINITY_DN11190_c0_g2~~TRINITY_DN11190_c0_g2_i1.p1  ORF type:complete len:570 (-),score=68.23 TRINITY_DN11190_c0_g2_i1:438-2147(-)
MTTIDGNVLSDAETSTAQHQVGFGQVVEAHDLKSAAELNGQVGVVVTDKQPNGRFGVRFLLCEQPKSLKPDNLCSLGIATPALPNEPPAVEERSGMGRCLIARSPTRAGNIICCDKPCDVIVGAYGTEMNGDMMQWSRNEKQFKCHFDLDVVVDHFAKLSDSQLAPILLDFEAHDEIEDLLTQSLAAAEFACSLGRAADKSKEDMARYIRILSLNAMRIDGMGSSALYPIASKVAHSCEPNAMYDIVPGGALMLRAIRDIPVGAVLTISYLPDAVTLLVPTVCRQSVLRTQKEFMCQCKRCLSPDASRVLFCRDCTGDSLRDGTGTWNCSSCEKSCTDLQMDLAKEEALMSAAQQAGRDLQDVPYEGLWMIRDRAKEALGEKHFVTFHVDLHLLKKHLLDAKRILGDEAMTKQMKEDLPVFKRRLLVPAVLLLRRLEKWVEAYAGTLRFVLLPEAVYRVIKALGQAGFMGDAVVLSLKYFAVNRTVYGDHTREAQLFRALLAEHATATPELGELCLRPGCGAKAERCCQRCGLAPYCSVPCELKDRAEHGFLCITAEGRSVPKNGGHKE